MRLTQSVLVTLLAIASGSALFAQTTTTIDFEQFTGPTRVGACSPSTPTTVDGVQFYGGGLVTAGFALDADQTTVYASDSWTCTSWIQMVFDPPVAFLQMRAVVGYGAYFWIHDNVGGWQYLPGGLPAWLSFPYSGISTVTIQSWSTFSLFAIDDLSFVSAARHKQVVASVSGGAEETAQADGSPLSAHVPLGAAFTLSLQDADGNPIPSTYSLGTASLAEGVDADAVFPGLAVLQYSSQPDPSSANFQAVHLGSVPLTIRPAEGGSSPVNLTILVEAPASLGTAHPDFDALIISISHAKGLPPQYIKAVAHHESAGAFNPNSYRYEPIGAWVGDLDVITHGQNLRLQSPYADYRLATSPDYGASDPPLTQGTNIDQADIDVRNIYYVNRPDCSIPASTVVAPRPIKPCDTYVSAREIYFVNPRQNWSSGSKGALVEANPALLEFTAQTGLASSYGLMQVTYVKAIQDLKWQGIADASGSHPAGSKNPTFLFDAAENQAIAGGSLRLGTKFLAEEAGKVIKKKGLIWLTGEERMRDAFTLALIRYNGSTKYPPKVLPFVSTYLPVASRAIF